MLLIYTDNTSARLQYICRFIFRDELGLAYNLTTHKDSFASHDGPKIIYGTHDDNGAVKIEPYPLLFETGIQAREILCFTYNEHKAFFKNTGDGYAFDLFAACFYLLSRYEEYLPHEIDIYGRFAHTNSLAFKEQFLELPLINIWINDFAGYLSKHFPALTLKKRKFNYLPTYDIDIAYSYRHKGLFRSVAGFIKSPSVNRIKVMLGFQEDDYAAYDYLDRIHENYSLNPVYFFLAATRNSKFDKNISPYSQAMGNLIKRHASKYAIGLHPSWRSFNIERLIAAEKKILESTAGKPVTASRQHYIKMSLPKTYRQLVECGITDDYSMGYGSINGFRASTGSPFYWYDLPREKITNLCLHPFCFMDANSFYEENLNASEASEELMDYLAICRRYNCEMITIFHNQLLGTGKEFKGWRDLYDNFIAQAVQP